MALDAPKIHDAVPSDAAAIAAIYNQGIIDRIATLETEERTPEERLHGSPPGGRAARCWWRNGTGQSWAGAA